MTGSEFKAKTINAGQQIWWRTKNFTRNAVDAGKKGIKWVIDNPEKATAGAAAGAAFFGGANKLVRSIHRNVTVRREMYDKRHRVYDRSLGMFIYTKNPISKKEVQQIYAERRKTGERVCEIMARKGMLKK